MMNTYEERVIKFESYRNKAMDEYFSARPNLVQDRGQEKLFEDGFRMAWEELTRLRTHQKGEFGD
jgi:hypothetical protein